MLWHFSSLFCFDITVLFFVWLRYRHLTYCTFFHSFVCQFFFCVRKQTIGNECSPKIKWRWHLASSSSRTQCHSINVAISFRKEKKKMICWPEWNSKHVRIELYSPFYIIYKAETNIFFVYLIILRYTIHLLRYADVFCRQIYQTNLLFLIIKNIKWIYFNHFIIDGASISLILVEKEQYIFFNNLLAIISF